MAGPDEKDKGFKVVDRRHSAEPAEPAPEPAPAPPAEELPEIDFSTFLLSLSTSAFIHLGEIPHPETGRPERSLPMARQTIDTLSMLQQKTQGNLSRDESRLLEHLLYELRLKFVEASKAK